MSMKKLILLVPAYLTTDPSSVQGFEHALKKPSATCLNNQYPLSQLSCGNTGEDLISADGASYPAQRSTRVSSREDKIVFCLFLLIPLTHIRTVLNQVTSESPDNIFLEGSGCIV